MFNLNDIQAKAKEFIAKNGKKPTYLLISAENYAKFVKQFTPREKIKTADSGQYAGITSIYLEDDVQLDILKMGDQTGIEII